MSKYIFSLLFVLSALLASAQESAAEPQMADAFRENGKIYVVITVIAIVMAAIVGFLVYLERKLKRLEREVNKQD